KVKAATQLLKTIELDNSKITVVFAEKVPAMVKTWRNLPNVTVTYANLLNTYEIVNGGVLVLAEEAIKVMENTFTAAGEKQKATTPSQSVKAAEKAPATAKKTAASKSTTKNTKKAATPEAETKTKKTTTAKKVT